MNWFDKIFGGGIKDLVLGIFDRIKGMTPEDRAKIETLLQQNNFELARLQLEMEAKIEEGLQAEVKEASQIIQQEAKSESWLPRNVRPLLLLLWGLMLTIPAIISLVQAARGVPYSLPVFDPWLYKLTVIGYTGYVAFRSADKLFGGEGGTISGLGVKFDSKGDKK